MLMAKAHGTQEVLQAEVRDEQDDASVKRSVVAKRTAGQRVGRSLTVKARIV